MRIPDDSEVREMMHSAQLARKTKIIGKLLAGGTDDLTGDRDLYLAFNREKIPMDDLVKYLKPECKGAEEATKIRRAADEKDYNTKSKAKWRIIGHIPSKVYFARKELWNNPTAQKKFLNTYTDFRVSQKPV